MIWSHLATSVLFASFFSAHASPKPLTTTASTTTTMQTPAGSGDSSLLIHVLRTEDLIADKLESRPLLLEQLSHLIIRVELGKDSVAVNGHSLAVLGGSPNSEPLEVTVQLKQVQMLKMPKDSPLVPLGLSSPELLKISQKYMSEGLVGAVLSVKQEPLSVEAIREDGQRVQAKAFKVTIAMKILELEGLSLEQISLPPVDLLHLIVHPDPENPTKVATMTTLAPEQVSGDYIAPIDPISQAASALGSFLPSGLSAPADLFGAALAATAASLHSVLSAISNTAGHAASHAADLLRDPHNRHHHGKPCRKHHAPHHSPIESATSAASVAQAAPAAVPVVDVAAQQQKDTAIREAPKHRHITGLPHALACLIKMATRSSMAIFVIGLPLLMISLILALVRRKFHKKQQAQQAAQYRAISSSENGGEAEKFLVDEDIEKV